MISIAERDDLVRQRAGRRCEYCRMHQSLQGGTFHVEHIQPKSRGGDSELANLALACPSCNLHKSDRTEFADPLTGATVPLFHPRQARWREHFDWDEFEIIGLTPIGRATVTALKFNEPRRARIRQAEKMFDLFPPDDVGGESDSNGN